MSSKGGVTTSLTPRRSPRAARSCCLLGGGVRLAGGRQKTSANVARQVVQTFEGQAEVLC